jgi:hypothetical protein
VERVIVKVLVVLALVGGLPLFGVAWLGNPLAPYLEFPPQPRSVEHAPFSWPMFVGITILVVLTLAPMMLRVARRGGSTHPVRPTHQFPWWGWFGGALTICSWILAWNRFSWFSAFQAHTFTPLWLGYVLLVNGMTYRRTGRCLMVERSGFFLALFPASAAFWWCFEYLNRFVHNWYYVGAQSLTAWEYFFYATIPFSTVLPAVLSTMELLASVPGLTAGADRLPSVHLPRQTPVGWGLLMVAGAGLAGIGVWPDRLFALVWVAPLILITAVQMITAEETIFSRLEQGDGTSLWLAALAALVCGICWEMWNYKSLAHWEYAIPSVHRFKLFEMPLLGYAGYLPFGLECLAVILMLFPNHYRELMTMLSRARPSQPANHVRPKTEPDTTLRQYPSEQVVRPVRRV